MQPSPRTCIAADGCFIDVAGIRFVKTRANDAHDHAVVFPVPSLHSLAWKSRKNVPAKQHTQTIQRADGRRTLIGIKILHHNWPGCQ